MKRMKPTPQLKPAACWRRRITVNTPITEMSDILSIMTLDIDFP